MLLIGNPLWLREQGAILQEFEVGGGGPQEVRDGRHEGQRFRLGNRG
jgi:hypothetical protein